MSSTSPRRRSGVVSIISVRIASFVSTISSAESRPTRRRSRSRGCAARSRRPSAASCARARPSRCRTRRTRGRARRPIVDEMLTIAPRPPASMCGIAALLSANAVVTLKWNGVLEAADRRVEERLGHRSADVVDDHVDAPELGHGRGDERLEMRDDRTRPPGTPGPGGRASRCRPPRRRAAPRSGP